jgi:hypothetical protein
MECNRFDEVLCGRELLIWGRKFFPNPKGNYIKVLGSAGSVVNRELSQIDFKKVEKMDPSFSMRGNKGDFFNKKERLMLIPQKGSNCPDAKGRGGPKKHISKIHGHTPNIKYKVVAGKEISALCYLDNDRQKRKTEFTLEQVEKRYSLS